MTDIKQFSTAAQGRTNPEKQVTVPFDHDGRHFVATKPKDGQLALLMASVGGYSSEVDQAKGTIDFFVNLFEKDDDKRYWADRLLDSKDDFDIEDLEEITYWLIAQFSERPTKPSSDSSSQQHTSGDGSTGNAELAGSTSLPSTPASPAT